MTSRTPLPRRLLDRTVRGLTATRSLLLAILVSSATVLACNDDPAGPDGTGRINLRIVPLEEARPATGADRAAADTDRDKPTATDAPGTSSQPDSLGDPQGAAPGVAAQAAEQQVPRRDIIRITLTGPTNFTQDFTPNADGSVDVTISDLLVGSYTVEVLGLDTDLGGELVSEFGRTTGVTVREDQTTDASVPFGSFLPVIDPATPTTTAAFAFEINYSSVPTATGYLVEADVDPNFTAPSTLSLSGTSAVISVSSPGTIHVRVRAENASVAASEAKPSDPVTIDVVTDLNPTGDGSATAPSLGVGRGANGQYDGYNIYPADDEDWFAIDLTTDATLTVDVLTSSLTAPPPDGGALQMPAAAESPSDLDPVVEIFDPSLALVDSNDDRDGTTLESRVSDVPVSVDGTYYIRVTSFAQSSVGHYELRINVNAEPVASVTVTPTSATILPTATVQLTGQTFDQFGGELFGREAIWTSSDDLIATVDGDGLVTGVAVGQATITFESEGVQATASIDVSDVAVAKVVITPNSGQLQGIGQTLQLTAQALDATDTPISDKPINWYTTNTYVADAYEGAILGEGTVEALGNGQTIVVAEADGIEGFALVTVTDPLATPVNYWDTGPASGTTETLLGIWGASSTAAWAVGANGTILRYDGSAWTPQTSTVVSALYSAWGEDDYSIWVVGDAGTILATGDMGANWAADPSPTTETLTGIWGAAWNDIFAVGGAGGTGTILHFDGSLWSTMTIPVADPLLSVFGFASDDVFAVGANGTILHYDGSSWTQMTSNTTEVLRGVWGSGPNDVFAVGANGTIVHYDGLTWSTMTSNTIAFLRTVWGTSASEVIAAGDNGTAVHYDGSTWTVLGSGTVESLRRVWGSPNPGVFAVGGTGTVRLGIRGATAEITAAPTSILPDGISTSTITVQAKDASGTNVTSGGADVTLSTDAGSLSAVTDNGDGTYTATLTSSTTVETATVTGTLNGGAIADDATVRFTTASATESTISGSPTSIPADGASTSTITVQVKDGSGTPLLVGGEDVTLSTDLGTLSAVTDNGDGTYTATLTAGTTVGFATISGTLNGQAMSDAIVTIRSTSPPDLIASTSGGGGANPSALYSIDRTTGAASPIGMIGFNRVGAMDVHPSTGVLYAAAQRPSDNTPVLITIDPTTGVGTEIGPTGVPGGISDLSFHSNGTLYGHEATPGSHALHTFSLTTGVATTVGLTAISGGGNGLTFNATNSLFLAATSTLYALSTSTGTGPSLGGITFDDPNCGRIKAIDRDPATDVFYAVLECGTTDALGTLEITAGTATFIGSAVADLDGIVDPATSTAPSTGPASETTSEITTNTTRILPDGSSTADITVRLRDGGSAALDVGGDHVALSTTLGSLGAVTDNGDGTYVATLTSGTTAGTATITGTLNGAAMVDDATVAISSAWAITGSMAAAREGHTATLLDDGTVLVIGWFTAGAEIYDPATGMFSATAGAPAFTHGQGVTATKLLDGRVLIVGGNGAPISAEIYDPVTGLFSVTGSSSVDRRYHTATLLEDGTVLVAGGQDDQPQTHDVVEIYDPATGMFTLTGSLIDDRSTHGATLLPDGRVLVLGGVQTTDPGFGICLNKGEIYDPASGTFSSTAGDMVNARCDVHPVSLNSGDVLVVGDSWSAAELFDPISETFSATGSMSIGHWVGTATLLSDGRVLVAGGLESGPVALADAEIYDPATGSFSPTASLNTARWDHTATLLPDGRVLVTGGDDGAATLLSAELH